VPDLGAPVLIQALGGFVDAGGATRLARQHLLALETESTLVATFDVDQLYDYRARRPTMLFVKDRWDSYDDPHLGLHRLTDGQGTPFLLLTGPEPDVQWERFVAAVMQIVERLGVRLTVGLNAIPMAVPHTRPVDVTAHATRPELVAGYTPWIDTVHVPAAAGALLEWRLGQAGRDAVGFAVHVPHYVSQLDYPPAAETLLEHVSRSSGLVLPTTALREAWEAMRPDLEAQVERSAEVAAVVRGLEEQYDAFLAARTGGGLLTSDAQLPSADELGAELERFLAEHDRGSGRESGEG
jgi:hypothetical protein